MFESMKGLRRSLHKDANHQHTTSSAYIPPLSKPVSAVIPPQKVIRALQSYRSTNPQELSFQKGDFFYVTRELESSDGLYEANNPMTGARGVVSKRMFEEFSKPKPQQRISTPAGPTAMVSKPLSPVTPPARATGKRAFYALVMHEFTAERPDELDARPGEMLSVVAQSNREWFVAKPIGKLGGPGLIPVSFVELRDPATGQPLADLEGMMDRGEIPSVEEWKLATVNYKASSIPLGKIDDAASVLNSPFQQMALQSPNPDAGSNSFAQYPSAAAPPPSNPNNPYGQPPIASYDDNYDEQDSEQQEGWNSEEQAQRRFDVSVPLPPGILLKAGVSSFHFEAGDWQFRVNATYRPDPVSKATNPFDATQLDIAKELTLFRSYDDFFVLQVRLLESFPLEAGRDPERPFDPPEDEDAAKNKRILPYMPGPQDDVDEIVTDSRRGDLDVYVQELVALRDLGAEHVVRSELLRKFLAPRKGDIENEIEIEPELDDDLGLPNAADYGASNYYSTQKELENGGRSNYDGAYDNRARTNGTSSPYGRPPPPPQQQPPLSSANRPQYPYGQSSSAQRSSGAGRSSTGSADWNGTGSMYGRQEYGGGIRDTQSSFGATSPGGLLGSPPSNFNPPYNNTPYALSPQIPSGQPSPAATSSGAPSPIPRDTVNSFYSASAHGSQSGHGQPASSANSFVKIKIFHSSTDELIAIRVAPKVTLRSLMDKVRERLGGSVTSVKYRDGMGGGSFADIMDDQDLRAWMSSGDKLVLYAE